MKTLYAACLSRLGLSQSQAAKMHDSRLDTVKAWASGRRTVPQGAWDDLRSFEGALVDGATRLRGHWEASGRPPIEIDDAGGDPHMLMAAAGFVLGSTGPISIGETAATRFARQVRNPQ